MEINLYDFKFTKKCSTNPIYVVYIDYVNAKN